MGAILTFQPKQQNHSSILFPHKETQRMSSKKQMEEMIDGFKLLLTAKPPLFHYHTVRGNVSSYLIFGKRKSGQLSWND